MCALKVVKIFVELDHGCFTDGSHFSLQGLMLNSTLRCVSFSHSAMGDAMFATVAAGLQHAAALEVLLLCDCLLTDECFSWINLLIKFQGTQRTDLQWQSTLRADTPQRSPAPFEHSSSGFLTRYVAR